MQRIFRVLGVLGLSLATACGDDGPASEQSAVPPTDEIATTTEAIIPSDLTGLLLTATDVGSGWTATTDLDPADLGSLGESPCPDTALNPTIADRLVPTAGVIFERDGASMRGIQQLALTGVPSRLDTDLGLAFDGMQACLDIEITAPDGELVEYQAFDIPELGDQRMAVRVTALEPPDFQTTWLGHMAIVRVGAVAIAINEFEIVESPDAEPQMSDADFVALLEQAVAKLG